MFNRLPVYQQLIEKLKDEIDKGRLGPPGAIISARNIARSYELSRDTVNKAMGELQALGYLAREAGRGFRLKESNQGRLCMNIGIVATYAEPSADGFYGNIISGIEQTCRKDGFLITWLGAGEGNAIDSQYLLELHKSNRVDGFVFLAVEDTELINLFVEREIPVVAADYRDDALTCSSVALDNAGGCALAVEKMVDSGTNSFAIVTRETSDDYPSRERKTGYINALERAAIDISSDRIFCLNEKQVVPEKANLSDMMAEQYLAIAESCGPETCFLTAYSYHATHLLWAATKSFPGSAFSAATFGTLPPYATYNMPSIALDADSSELGRQAAGLILESISHAGTAEVEHLFVEMKALLNSPY